MDGSRNSGFETIVVVAGGGPIDPVAIAAIPDGAMVIAADSGVEHAEAAGLAVALLVGDFDSASPAAVARATASDTEVERFPQDKDKTDLDLALAAARRRGPERIIVVGNAGGRFDHVLGNVAVLADAAGEVASGGDREAALIVEAWFGSAHLQVATPGGTVEVTGEPGSLVSLLALHGPVHGVRTTGLRWALHDEPLMPGSSRGLSNELTVTNATVTVASGVLVVIQP